MTGVRDEAVIALGRGDVRFGISADAKTSLLKRDLTG